MRSVKYLQVEGETSLIRDVSSNAIINNNDTEYELFKKRKEAQLKQTRRLEEQEKEIQSIKDDLAEIKQLLTALVKADK